MFNIYDISTMMSMFDRIQKSLMQAYNEHRFVSFVSSLGKKRKFIPPKALLSKKKGYTPRQRNALTKKRERYSF